ncbi:hypothetical protein [Burkholderia cenocepacia]|uniref:hypothetical protein n=1 Tax=Burkholderia cenocepacia TaxID=95486 RepID=UPI00285A73BE|nr:hypothetical protein [Burkholderia cenocepacia]MDR8049585.1 hypothetical protein [Burkholderia cenocepacia]
MDAEQQSTYAADTVAKVEGLGRRFVDAARGLTAAVEALAVARGVFVQVEEEMQRLVQSVDVRHGTSLSISNSHIATDLLSNHIQHMLGGAPVRQPLANAARRYHTATMRSLESLVNSQSPSRAPTQEDD